MSSQISFRDFLPEDRTRFLAIRRSYESLEELLARVNRWVSESSIEPIHVETLLLPGLPSKKKKVSTEVVVHGTLETLTKRFQAIRVWYRS